MRLFLQPFANFCGLMVTIVDDYTPKRKHLNNLINGNQRGQAHRVATTIHLKKPDKGAAIRVAPTQPMNIPKTNNPKPDLF